MNATHQARGAAPFLTAPPRPPVEPPERRNPALIIPLTLAGWAAVALIIHITARILA